MCSFSAIAQLLQDVNEEGCRKGVDKRWQVNDYDCSTAIKRVWEIYSNHPEIRQYIIFCDRGVFSWLRRTHSCLVETSTALV